MNLRKILLIVVLVLVALVAWRVAGIFYPSIFVLWLWRVLIAPYVLAVCIVLLLIIIAIVLCLGRIRYRVDAQVGSKNEASVKVSYLMKLVQFALVYSSGNQNIHIRIAGIRLGGKSAKKKRKAATVKTIEPPPPEEPPPPKPEKEEKTDRISPLSQVKAALTYPNRKIIMSLCLQSLGKFVRALRPKHLDISGVIGFDDPCTTGWAMGAYEAAASVAGVRSKVRILGNYIEKALELDIAAEGNTRLWGLVWPFIWLYLRRPIRLFLREVLFREQ
ncbi:MAG: hypothetical protein FWC77_05520 [Defluviitaleaceae bacterium]|nr:hypothetical protein [Defluviitaleaceae bacterium]